MKNVICFVLFLYLWGCPANGKNVVDYVNPFIGTAIKGEGGTVPYIGTPFGMTNFVPQTREGKMGNMPYVYDDEYLEGFLASHKPTIWMGDYGYVSIMPQIGRRVRVLPEERRMLFSHEGESASPHYYSVDLWDEENGQKIRAEMTASSRCALLRFHYPKKQTPRLIIHGINLNPALEDWCNHFEQRLKTMKGWVKIDVANNEIVGYNPDRQSFQLGPELPNFKGYFVIRFDKPIKEFGCWNDTLLYPGVAELQGTRMGAYVDFDGKESQINVQLATSFISIEQARSNLEREVPQWNFEKLSESTKQAWEDKLSRFRLIL